MAVPLQSVGVHHRFESPSAVICINNTDVIITVIMTTVSLFLNYPALDFELCNGTASIAVLASLVMSALR